MQYNNTSYCQRILPPSSSLASLNHPYMPPSLPHTWSGKMAMYGAQGLSGPRALSHSRCAMSVCHSVRPSEAMIKSPYSDDCLQGRHTAGESVPAVLKRVGILQAHTNKIRLNNMVSGHEFTSTFYLAVSAVMRTDRGNRIRAWPRSTVSMHTMPWPLPRKGV